MADKAKRFRRLRRLYHKIFDDKPTDPGAADSSQSSATPHGHSATMSNEQPGTPASNAPAMPSTPLPPSVSPASPTPHSQVGHREEVLPAAPNPSALGNASDEGWGGLKMLAGLLAKTPGGLGPLKSAADVLVSWIDTFETVAENRKELKELKIQLDGLFSDLQKYIDASGPPTITASIKNLNQGITLEIKRLEQIQKRNGMGNYLVAEQDADEVVKCYQRIKGLFQRLTLNTNLDTWKTVKDIATDTLLKALPNSPAAYYRSTDSTSLRRDACTPETRVELLKQLYDWACDESGPKIYWLNGMAGTGKTTVAYSLCQHLEKNHALAASFFCYRQLQECSKVGRIIPSVSYQLSRYSHPFRHVISSVLAENPDAHNQRVSDQLKDLIVDPMSQIKNVLPTNLVVVIDALDECDSDIDLGLLLDALLEHSSASPVKFFITSRPDVNILNRMRNRQGEKLKTELRLHEIEHPIVQNDIRTYLSTHLRPRLTVSDAQLEILVKRSGVLFIYAATAIRHIGTEDVIMSEKRLEELLEVSRSSSNASTEAIDALYTTIMKAAFNNKGWSKNECATVLQVVHTVICAREPFSKRIIAGFLNLNDKNVHIALLPLLSVLNVSETDGLITTLHESFRDYLLDPSRSGEFYCNAAEHNALLAKLCFYHTGTPSQFNICELESICQFDEDVPRLRERVDEKVSGGLFYACRYWDAHFMSATVSVDLFNGLAKFVSERLLMWMEVMNLKDSFAHGIRMMHEFGVWLQDKQLLSQENKGLIHDAWRFMNSCYASPVLRSTAHIYASGMLFWPENSPIRSRYKLGKLDIVGSESTALKLRRITPLVTMKMGEDVVCTAYSPSSKHIAVGLGDGNVEIRDAYTGQKVGQPLQSHGARVWSVAYSPDGAHIVSGSDDRTVRIWSVQTGEQVGQLLQGHDGSVFSVAYSPDGARIVSGSDDRTVRIWSVQTGEQVGQPLQGHSDWVRSVGYSPDGAHIVSGSSDSTVRIWSVQTGEQVGQPLQGHDGSVSSVAYSADGAHIVSGSSDRTVRIWSVQTGKQVGQPLQGHSGWVRSVGYSPDGAHIVSGSDDRTVRIWSVQTGEQVGQPLQGHDRPVLSVAYSPDGAHIVSGSDDSTVRIWSVQTGEQVGQPLQGHSGWVRSVGYSPDGAHIVSGSDDRTVRIWSVQTGEQVGQPLQGHDGSVFSVAYSPDGAHTVSGSSDRTGRIWSVQTGEQVGQPLQGHDGSVFSVAYSPDGAHIISGSDDSPPIQRFHLSRDAGQHSSITSQQITVTNGLHSNNSNLVLRTYDPHICHSACSQAGSHRQWEVNDEGWVALHTGEALVWVPSDLRVTLLRPQNSMIASSPYGVLYLRPDQCLMGKQWASYLKSLETSA
ncbi:Vegetative incompatibility protein HET-E-1 [Ceratobasidium sp. AG-Ba]|nr:Vegetative incompatibility protein HET-E-1 [Ceratobasidium sp. AG-Ba]